MNHPDWQLLAEKAALYLYPRRCPFCGAVLGRDAVPVSYTHLDVYKRQSLSCNQIRKF